MINAPSSGNPGGSTDLTTWITIEEFEPADSSQQTHQSPSSRRSTTSVLCASADYPEQLCEMHGNPRAAPAAGEWQGTHSQTASFFAPSGVQSGSCLHVLRDVLTLAVLVPSTRMVLLTQRRPLHSCIQNTVERWVNILDALLRLSIYRVSRVYSLTPACSGTWFGVRVMCAKQWSAASDWTIASDYPARRRESPYG